MLGLQGSRFTVLHEDKKPQCQHLRSSSQISPRHRRAAEGHNRLLHSVWGYRCCYGSSGTRGRGSLQDILWNSMKYHTRFGISRELSCSIEHQYQADLRWVWMREHPQVFSFRGTILKGLNALQVCRTRQLTGLYIRIYSFTVIES